MAARRWSLLIFRTVLRVYPREFRERFSADLESDFLQLAAVRGLRAAWSKPFSDLLRAIPLTHRAARAERLRRERIGGPFRPGDPTMNRPNLLNLLNLLNLPNLLFDARHALRSLLKSPVFT